MEQRETIGITGGIGSGKSVVSRVIRCNGLRVFDCDYEAKKIMIYDKEIKEKLISKLGEEVYLSDGSVNKAYLSKLLFSSDDVREYVNSIVHEAVRNKIIVCQEASFEDFFIESAILASGGIAKMCNEIWIIASPLNLRIKMVEKRDNTTEDYIKKILESQSEELELLKQYHADVIENDNAHPLLPKVLTKIKKYNINQTFTMPC